jgi:hypothetical protein
MPSALWTYYDRELWRAVREANLAGDADRLAALLAQAVQFGALVALVDDRARLAEVRRDTRWLMGRVAELAVRRAAGPARAPTPNGHRS